MLAEHGVGDNRNYRFVSVSDVCASKDEGLIYYAHTVNLSLINGAETWGMNSCGLGKALRLPCMRM